MGLKTISERLFNTYCSIVQAGTGTDQIGRFDINIDTDNNCIDTYTWQTVPINSEHCPNDEDLENILNHYKDQTDMKYGRLVTRFKKKLTHPDRNRETALGGLFSDIMRETLGLDIMLLGSGSVRTEQLGPVVLFSDLCECFPYDAVYLLKVTGEQFKRMIKYMVRDEVWEGVHCEFYQLSSGLRIEYDKANHSFSRFDFKGEAIEDGKIYKVGLQKYHYINFEEFFNVPFDEILKNGTPVIVSTSCRSVFDEYLSSHQNLDREVSVPSIIRTCPKASLFSAFRGFGFERRQPVGTLNRQKSSENPSFSGRRFFIERIFGNSRHKTEQILCGFASILTQK